jgi:hypothetical protein
MSAGIYPIIIDQGSDFAVGFQIDEEGVAKDLTNYLARAQIRTTKTSAVLSGSFTCVISDALAGKIQMTLANADSAVIPSGVYYYDMEIYTAGDASVTRMLEGTVTINQEVTRP